MRELDKDLHTTYYFESDEQWCVFYELSDLLLKDESMMVEAIRPGYYSEGDEHVFTLSVTVVK